MVTARLFAFGELNARVFLILYHQMTDLWEIYIKKIYIFDLEKLLQGGMYFCWFAQ